MKRQDGHQVSKLESVHRIATSALILFASRGYDGTSLRDIADHARVPLSLIDRHFGQKAKLFEEVHFRAWRAINKEREELLAKAKIDSGGVPNLENLVTAFTTPIVMLAFNGEHGRALVRILREGRALNVHRELSHGPERNAVRDQWIAAFMTACPGATRPQATWGFALVVEAVSSSQLLDNWLDDLMPGTIRPSTQEVIRLVAAFCTAGLRAITSVNALQ